MTQQTVEAGDCVLSISAAHGIPWKRVWDHPNNADLKELRGTPSILFPGDSLFIPPNVQRTESVSSEKKHRFVIRIPQITLRIEIAAYGEPRANEPYHVEVGDKRYAEDSTTDEKGSVECRLPAQTRTAVIVIGEDEDEYTVELGCIDPADTPQGLHSRLQNLGFYEDDVESEFNDGSMSAYADLLAEEEDPSASDKLARDPDAVGRDVSDGYGS